MGVAPILYATIIEGLFNAIAASNAPSPYQPRQSYGPLAPSIANSEYGDLNSLLSAFSKKAESPVTLPDATVQDLPVFAGSDLPMPIGVSGKVGGLAQPYTAPGLDFSGGPGGLNVNSPYAPPSQSSPGGSSAGGGAAGDASSGMTNVNAFEGNYYGNDNSWPGFLSGNPKGAFFGGDVPGAGGDQNYDGPGNSTHAKAFRQATPRSFLAGSDGTTADSTRSQGDPTSAALSLLLHVAGQ